MIAAEDGGVDSQCYEPQRSKLMDGMRVSFIPKEKGKNVKICLFFVGHTHI